LKSTSAQNGVTALLLPESICITGVKAVEEPAVDVCVCLLLFLLLSPMRVTSSAHAVAEFDLSRS
jgi:hypothetical protein